MLEYETLSQCFQNKFLVSQAQVTCVYLIKKKYLAFDKKSMRMCNVVQMYVQMNLKLLAIQKCNQIWRWDHSNRPENPNKLAASSKLGSEASYPWRALWHALCQSCTHFLLADDSS